MLDNGKRSRRNFLAATGAVGITTLSGCLGDDDGDDAEPTDDDDDDGELDYPTEDVELVIPYSPGGGFDWYGRLVANHADQYFDSNIVVNNVEGAGGDVANQEVFNAEPDGYTFQIFYPQSAARSKIMDPDLDFEPGEYTFFPQVAGVWNVINFASHVEIETFDEFTEAMADGELRLGSTGPTGTGASIIWSLGELTGLWDYETVLDNSVHVDGTADMIPLAERGDLEIVGAAPGGIVEHYEEDLLRPFLELKEGGASIDALTERDTLTLDDLDVDNKGQIEASTMVSRGFAGPPDIPDERADVLRDALSEAIQSDELQAEGEEAGRIIEYASSEEYAETSVNAAEAAETLEDVLRAIQD